MRELTHRNCVTLHPTFKMKIMKENNSLRNPLSPESREKAVLSPSDVGTCLRVTAAPVYLLAAAVLLMIGAFIVWGFLGNVTDKANYQGVVFPAQGTVDIGLPNSGVVRTMFVHKGDSVTQGQTIALVSIGEGHSFLTSKVKGYVISTLNDNESFQALEPIVSIVDVNSPDNLSQGTQLIAYADYEAQRDLEVGAEAQVWPSDEKRDEIGYIRGRITKVVRYPATDEEMRLTLKSDLMAQRLKGGNDVVYEVRIDLLHSAENPGEYDWSFGVPAGVSMGIGTHCSVLTQTNRRSIFVYLFEEVKRKFHAVEEGLK